MGYADEYIIPFWIEWYKADPVERRKMLEKLVDLHQPIFLEPNVSMKMKRQAFITLLQSYLEDFADALEYYFQKEKGGDESGC